MSNTVLQLGRDDEALLLLDELRQLTNNKTQLERRIKILREQLENIVGDSDEFISPDGLPVATFRVANDSVRFDEKSFKEQYSELYSQFKTKVVKGSRRLLIDRLWGGI